MAAAVIALLASPAREMELVDGDVDQPRGWQVGQVVEPQLERDEGTPLQISHPGLVTRADLDQLARETRALVGPSGIGEAIRPVAVLRNAPHGEQAAMDHRVQPQPGGTLARPRDPQQLQGIALQEPFRLVGHGASEG